LDPCRQASEDGDEQPPLTEDNLRPNFDLWEDLNIYQGLDLWQEDFGVIENPVFPFTQAEECAGEIDNIASNQRIVRLERSSGPQEDGCRQNVWRERDGSTVNLPLFNTSATQTAC
jgi:hypothetical protein